jgi:hypothetical protein
LVHESSTIEEAAERTVCVLGGTEYAVFGELAVVLSPTCSVLESANSLSSLLAADSCRSTPLEAIRSNFLEKNSGELVCLPGPGSYAR